MEGQISLFDENAAPEQTADVARRAIDELFSLARTYRSGRSYLELMRFIARFRAYSPFNAMLVHIQMPGAVFVAPPSRWLRRYGRRIRGGAQPLVILQPMGPVMFVFDVSDTVAEEGAADLRREVTHPFEVMQGQIGDELKLTGENAKRDGVRVQLQKAGSQSAGSIERVEAGQYLDFVTGLRPQRQSVRVPVRYEILLNQDHSPETRYASLAHELTHLYLGHLGTPDERWWPDRRGLSHDICEFEAESVSFLICTRLGINTPSEQYLSEFCSHYSETPPISLDSVMKAAGLIEQMGVARLPPRKERDTRSS